MAKIRKVSVAVFGAGPSGLTVAIAAARKCVKVILVERTGVPGGCAASGPGILGYLDRGGRRALGGISQEYVDRLSAKHGSLGSCICPIHNSITGISPEILKIVAIEMCKEAGVRILFNCDAIDVNIANGRVRHVKAFGKCTQIDIQASVFIDGTGDGVITYHVDEETVALCSYNVGIHSGTRDHIDLTVQERPFGLPYGCMVSELLDGLLLIGRTIGAYTTAYAAAHVVGPLIVMAEAAGYAAALGKQPRNAVVELVCR